MRLTESARTVLAAGALALGLAGGSAQAACGIAEPAAASQVTLLANSFPVLQFLANQMKACSTGRLTVDAKLTPDVTSQARTMLAAGGVAPFPILQISNGSFVEFSAKGYLQPITDLVKKYWDQYDFKDIPDSLWKQASVDGEIYAIPFETNAEVLFYRKDLFDKAGIAVPATYAEFLAAAEKLKAADPSLDEPIAETLGGNWSLATEWGNIYQGLGGTWFDAQGKPTFNDDKGVRAVELLRGLLPQMSPNGLSFSNDDVMVAFQQGKAAMGVLWASRAANMDAADVSRVAGKFQFAPAPAPSAGNGPATVLWWDGFVLPKTIGVDRDLAFRIIAEATSKASFRAGADLTYYSRLSITTDPALAGKFRYWPAMNATIDKGTQTFPAVPYFNVAHTAIGANLGDALRGKVTAKEALDRAAATYLREGKAQGYF